MAASIDLETLVHPYVLVDEWKAPGTSLKPRKGPRQPREPNRVKDPPGASRYEARW